MSALLLYNPADTEMLGATGTNRTSLPNGLGAKNDHEAILGWLAFHQQSDETHRAYAREARRLVYWCVLVKRKPVSSLTAIDMLEYEQFLLNPPADLIGARVRQSDADWKPFAGHMSQTSVNRCLLVLVGMFSFLERQKYIHLNPMSEFKRLMTKRKMFQPGAVQRILDAEQLQAVKRILDTRNEEYIQRTRFALSLMYFLGLRISEVTSSTMGAFFQKRDGTWRMNVNGKGDKDRVVPVPPAMVRELQRYRERFLGMAHLPTQNETTPLLENFKVRSGGLGERELRNDVKAVFALAADLMDDHDKAALLRKASPHWLRHTAATAQTKDATLLEMSSVQASFGWESPATAFTYAEHDDETQYRLSKDMHWEGPAAPYVKAERK